MNKKIPVLGVKLRNRRKVKTFQLLFSQSKMDEALLYQFQTPEMNLKSRISRKTMLHLKKYRRDPA